MDILGQSALVVAVVSCSLAFSALSRKLRNSLVVQYAILCFVISAWALTFFLEKIFLTGFCYQLHLGFNVILTPVALRFVRSITRTSTRFTKLYDSAALVYSAIVLLVLWLGLIEGSFFKKLATFAPSFLLLECVRLMIIDVRKIQLRVSEAEHVFAIWPFRRLWIYVGALVLLGTAVMDHLPSLGKVIPSIGNGLLCIYLFVFSEAIIHQRLFNRTALVSRVFILIFMSAVCSAIFAAFVGWVEREPALFALNAFVASTLFLIVLDPIRKLALLVTAKLSGGRDRELREKVRRSEEILSGVVDSMGLAQHVLAFLEDVFVVKSASVFVLRSDESKYRRIRGLRDDFLPHTEILASHSVVEFFSRLRRRSETPIVLETYLENEIEQGLSQTQRVHHHSVLLGLRALKANIAIPFFDEDRVLGFIVAHVQSGTDDADSDWSSLPIVYRYFLAAARMLKNMDVYVRIREKERLAALGQMSAGLAHEIRNPLGAIKGAAQVLEGETAYQASPFLRVIVEEVNRLNKVVTQFLDYSKPMHSEYSVVDVETVLEKTVALFQSVSPEGVRIEQVRSHVARPRFVKCSPEQIKQVLVNLIQNSIQSLEKWKPEGGGVIRLGVIDDRRNGAEEAILFVEDNGAGIAREDIDKIFIPFFTKKQKGTGLGLSICSKIIEAHGGRIEVHSDSLTESGESGVTRFVIRLPAAAVTPDLIPTETTM